ncbi:shikimate kinase [Desulfonema ishimotonii]|uniref:Shikimate kinase n=1 Tax=Desulfonema ishimotonii TaxID=45657 RepID=A0A401G0T9_9BACT|nr:shikimate kinase [Desulfonema ishimotonii]GBC62839.1 shikimate kinase [Desulfonema ishimotonii]
MSEKKNIVLIGMPGAGKSTVGVLLAKRLKYDFLDTDILIQAHEGRSLQQIIQAGGVRKFRETEEHYVCRVSCHAHVIATGGSVVYSERAMSHLAADGHVVFLDLSLATLKKRLSDIDARGVIRLPGQTIDDLYAERTPLYRRHGRIVVPCDDRTPDQVMNAVARNVVSS